MGEHKEVVLADLLQNKGYIRGPFGSALRRPEMKEEGVPVYEQQHAIYNLREFRYYIDDEKFEELKRFQVKTNDLIISCSGTVGKVSIIREDDPKGIISQALLILRADTSKVLPEYLKYFFSSYKGYNAIVSRSSGSVQVNISKRAVIEQIPLSLPDLSEQEMIVDVLKTIDDKILNNEAINRNLQQQLNSYFSYISENASDIYSISDYCDLGSSKRVFARDYKLYGVPFYRGKEISIKSNGQLPSDLLYISPEHYAELKKKSGAPQDGDILITAVGTIGNSYMVHNEEFYFKDGNIIWLKNFTSKEINYYIFDYMQSLQFKNDLAAITIGSTQQALTIISLSKMKIQVPSNQYLKEYYSFSKKIHDSIVANQAENSRLVEIRDTLLPKLMSGDLDVSDLDI